jgi:CHAT domain-containing protein
MAGAETLNGFDTLDAVRPTVKRWRRYLAARVVTFAAIGATGVVIVIGMLRPPLDAASDASIASVIATTVRDARPVEPRLTGGSPWAPYRGSTSSTGSIGSELTPMSATGEVVARSRGNTNRQALHTAGVAHLLAGHHRHAVATLQAGAESGGDGLAWSDLAVALYETSKNYRAPELVADALAASDRARAADPDLLEPLFNRALFLEHLGLRDDAREAWQQYLLKDGSSSWAAEARGHVQRLVPAKPFLETLSGGGNVSAAVRENPAEARAKTETNVLGSWATTILMRQDADAEKHLRIARAVGAELAALNGDRSVALAVAAIDAATPDELSILASAHAEYQEGMKLFQSSRPVDAEPVLRRAVELFGRTRSPMIWRALFFAGNTTFDQGGRVETRRNVETLLGSVPDGFLAHRAELVWQLGVCYATDAAWGEAIRYLQQSATLFDELREARNAAAVRGMLAVVYDRIGDPAMAWNHRMAALRVAGEQSGKPLEKAVASIAGAAILRGKWQTALSFLTLQIGILRRVGDDVRLADALLSRAAVRVRLSDVAAARADAVEAEAVTSRVKDAAYVTYGRTAQSLVKAMLARSPDEAVASVTESIALQSTRGDRMNLPGLFLQRARGRRAMRDHAGAAADLESGITELERHRESLPQGSERWGAFFSAEELFEEGIDLAMSRGDAPRAFALAERARARTLLDTYGVAPSTSVRPVDGAVIVEYVALPSQLVVFVADARGVTAVSVKTDRNELARQADAFSNALADDDDGAARRTAAALYGRLIEPVSAQLTGAKTVVFVPDRTLAALPFSALRDEGGQYLLERHAVVVAPSAAAFVAAAARRRGVPESVVVIKAPGGGDTARLPFVDAEAREVARAYRRGVEVREETVDLQALGRAVASADVAHFAGHAIGDESGLVPASMVLQGGKRVTVPEIAGLRLPRPVTVVLAGCSTARGESRGPEGVISVANGFLFAGAPSVVATLWPIDDRAAAVFFPRLHRRLAEGLSPAEALRAVQLDAIRGGDVPASLWAALIDIGS